MDTLRMVRESGVFLSALMKHNKFLFKKEFRSFRINFQSASVLLNSCTLSLSLFMLPISVTFTGFWVYSGGPRFESWTNLLSSMTKIFYNFPQLSHANAGIVPQNILRLIPFRFIAYSLSAGSV